MNLYMSPMHILTTILIGIAIGCIADILALQRVPGGVKGFMLAGIIGAFTINFLFRGIVSFHILAPYMYMRPAIVVENIIGAILGVYLFNLIKWEA